jgi:hypothetical protein
MWISWDPRSEQNFHGFISSGLDCRDFLIAVRSKPYKDDDAMQDFFPIEGARGHVPGAADVFALTARGPE